MDSTDQKLNMHEPAVFRICVQGELDERWSEYFSAQSVTMQKIDGQIVTVITSEPMDQSALVGLINHLNNLGIPLISVDPIRPK